MSFTVKLIDQENQVESLVDFVDCESTDDPCEVVFRDMSMWFPFHAIANREGHIRRDGLCSPRDFITKAEDMGFDAELLEQ